MLWKVNGGRKGPPRMILLSVSLFSQNCQLSADIVVDLSCSEDLPRNSQWYSRKGGCCQQGKMWLNIFSRCYVEPWHDLATRARIRHMASSFSSKYPIILWSLCEPSSLSCSHFTMLRPWNSHALHSEPYIWRKFETQIRKHKLIRESQCRRWQLS